MSVLFNSVHSGTKVAKAPVAWPPERPPAASARRLWGALFVHGLRVLSLLLPLSLQACIGEFAQASVPATAFFYGAPVPVEQLADFDRVVVEAGNVTDLAALQSRGATVFAYVSVGEAEGWRASAQQLPPGLFLGTNTQWQSRIADLTQPGWKAYLLEDRMAGLWAQGYRGFFLDTLDSYQIPAGTPEDKKLQAAALVDLIRAMQQRFPGVQLLLNRGFEILPDVAALAVGLVAESLFQGWNAGSQSYVTVSAEDRAWLLQQLMLARDRYGLPVTVIDYVDPSQRELIHDTERRIAALGFFPWVATPGLDVVYTGAAR